MTPKKTGKENLLILSDFNADILCGLLNNDGQNPSINAVASGYGQAIPLLLKKDDSIWEKAQMALVWTRPEAVSETFARAVQMEDVDHRNAIQEVDLFCDVILNAGKRVSTILAPTWRLTHNSRGYGMLDLRDGLGIRALLRQMNQRLVQRISGQEGVYLLDSARWFTRKESESPKMWYLAKVPFSQDIFKSAIGDLKSALRGIRGEARKIVICDLDDTLWGGILGETGWENLCLGGHDPIGEALIDFQSELKALTRRGIVLGIVSKNTEETALEAIEKHSEMVLRKKDFAGWRINWQDKAQNLTDLLNELNLGLQSAVFLDDNPVERARIRDACPQVLVPELPDDKLLYPKMIRELDCFDVPFLSEEDRHRTPMYVTERRRRAVSKEEDAAGKVLSLDDWLPTLEIKVQAQILTEANKRRAAQLFNKTNQMNLSTRRMAEAELWDWASKSNRTLWTYSVSDKFGDSGLTGIAGIEIQGERALLTDYLLSCRIMGKRIEETIVYQVTEYARSLGAEKLLAICKPTLKNQPCVEFWDNSGFHSENSSHAYEWNLAKSYPFPNGIELTINEEKK